MDGASNSSTSGAVADTYQIFQFHPAFFQRPAWRRFFAQYLADFERSPVKFKLLISLWLRSSKISSGGHSGSHTTINAFVGMDNKHVFALIKTIYGANLYTIGLLPLIHLSLTI